MNLLHSIKGLLVVFITLLFCSCGWLLKDHRFDYLNEKQEESLNIPQDKETLPIVDFYPVPDKSEIKNSLDNYEVPLPPQVFSSGSTNEIRMHKLGELRWLYVEALPSSVWPLMKDFWASNEYGLSYEDPNSGIIRSNEIITSSLTTKLEMKIEHGIRQASSEIFLSHLMRDKNQEWVKVPLDSNIEDKVLRIVLDFLSETPSSGGTSLVALNLNIGQKALLKQSKDGISFIEMDLEFPRAWAAVDRALKEAFIIVKDIDRKEGIFFVTFSQKKDVGFLRSLFSRQKESDEPEFKIFVEQVDKNKCTVKVSSESKVAESLERDLLSQINQSLS